VFGRDLLVDVDGGVERPRQRRVLDHRDAVLLGHGADLQGQGVEALGDADRAAVSPCSYFSATA
jgi:hypothetical protein